MTPEESYSHPPTPAPQKARSHGPGAGVKKTKAVALEDDYKKKKAKIQEGIVEVQKQRQADLANYVSNQARAQAFKMAVMGYNAFKHDDPGEAVKYKKTMENIVTYNTAANSSNETGMPPLDGNLEGV